MSILGKLKTKLARPEGPAPTAMVAAAPVLMPTASDDGISEQERRKLEKQRSRALKQAREAALAPKNDGKVRLNLGCGDKILPGFVNVDIAPVRKDMEPDVLCDLRDLTFEDGYADEVLSVHVIEHFYLWEVGGVLKEWMRVLKPGGKLILECPNLLTAAEELVRNPEGILAGGKEWGKTMFVFYGDPEWKDPLMCHRWGYTPQSLIKVMAEAGLTECHQEPALFKKGDPRDMRIVGTKP